MNFVRFIHVLHFFTLSSVLSNAFATETANAVEWNKIVTSRGNRLPDFSFSGYHASERVLPFDQATTKIRISVTQRKGDQTSEIQSALNQTAASGGGVVLLNRGNYTISAGLKIPGGVVLRGSGTGKTRLTLKKQLKVPVFTLGAGAKNPKPLKRARILDQYVPIGTSLITVNSSKAFTVGQSVFVQRTVTPEWIVDNGMDELFRDGVDQTWLEVGSLIQQPNFISSINGTKIKLRFPLTDALDAQYMVPEIVSYVPPLASSEMGIENLAIHLTTSCSGAPINNETCNYPAIRFASWSYDSWARSLRLTGFNQFVEVQYNASQITVQDVAMLRDKDADGAALPSDIWIKGSQILVKDCGQYGNESARSFSIMTGSLTPGPNAVLGHITQSGTQYLYPHQRWAHGLLVEDTTAPTFFVNRKTRGTGQGWSMSGGVGWNLRGEAVFESPPLGVNWCIGCRGSAGQRGNGTFINEDRPAKPKSLFESQLQARAYN